MRRLFQKKSPEPEVDLVREAQRALQAFWGTRGFHEGAADAADACRKLDAAQLRLLRAWVPPGSGITASKCQRAREIVEGVLAEKA